MILTQKQLIGLLVKTKSGRVLGHLKDFEMESGNFQIISYIVSSSKLVKSLLVRDLVIDRSQVIEINPKEMVVDDALVGRKEMVGELA